MKSKININRTRIYPHQNIAHQEKKGHDKIVAGEKDWKSFPISVSSVAYNFLGE